MDSKRNKQLSELRRQMLAFFNKEELMLVAFEIGVNWDDLPGERLTTKVHNLILQSDRSGKLDELITALTMERPNVPWQAVLKKREALPQVAENRMRTAVWNALYRKLWTKKTFLNSHKGKPPLIENLASCFGLITSTDR